MGVLASAFQTWTPTVVPLPRVHPPVPWPCLPHAPAHRPTHSVPKYSQILKAKETSTNHQSCGPSYLGHLYYVPSYCAAAPPLRPHRTGAPGVMDRGGAHLLWRYTKIPEVVLIPDVIAVFEEPSEAREQLKK